MLDAVHTPGGSSAASSTVPSLLTALVERMPHDRYWARTPQGPRMRRATFTKEMLPKHLNGGPPMGLCPIARGGSTTMVAVLDFDSHKGETVWGEMVTVAMRVRDQLELHELIPVAVRSTGGHGIHLIAVWDSPQDAYSVRALLRQVLEECGLREGAKGVANGQVEIFPKQDHVGVDESGSMFILPFAGKSVPLYEGNFEPFESIDAAPVSWHFSSPVPVLERPAAAPLQVAMTLDDPGLLKLQAALRAIPNEGDGELDYDEWLKLMMAIHAASAGSAEGFALATEFSSRSSKYDPEDLERRWNSFKLERDSGLVGAGSIFRRAREHGWSDVTDDEFEVLGPASPPVTKVSAPVGGIGKISGGLPESAGSAPVETVPPADQAGPQGTIATADDDVVLPALERRRDGRILATLTNLRKLQLTRGWAPCDIALDAFKGEVMRATPVGSGQWVPWQDVDYTRWCLHAEGHGVLPIGSELIRRVVNEFASSFTFDSAQLWLNGLQWDGVDRVTNFWQRYFGVPDSEYARACGRYTWTALAGRILTPGIEADMVPILVGRQGVGKSRGVAAMAPSRETFTELSLADSDEVSVRKMRGSLIGEFGELRGLHTTELERIKAFITRRVDHWTPKYVEHAIRYSRRCVFFGTTNQQQFLSDETGNRRFLPLQVGQVDVAGIVHDREQLWAQGAFEYALGGVDWSAERLAAQAHAEARIEDEWEVIIEQWLETPEDADGSRPRDRVMLTLADVLREGLHLREREIDRRSEMRAARAMIALGYARVRVMVGGERRWRWAKA